MIKTVLRVYNKHDEFTLTRDCYFLIMPDDYTDYDLEIRLHQVASMGWQKYTSYLIGQADVKDEECFWSEITAYDLKECKINIDRVFNIKKYTLPNCLNYDFLKNYL